MSKPEYIVDNNGCWIWQGNTLNGYGLMGTTTEFGRRAARVYYARVKGSIPDGYQVHHLCHVPLCVNPDHLEAISHRQHLNEHRMTEKGRSLMDVVRVRAERAAGATFREIAARHGLSYSTVRRWCGTGLEAAWTEELGDEVLIPERECDNPRCDVIYRGRPNKLYCSPRCRSITNHYKRKAAA